MCAPIAAAAAMPYILGTMVAGTAISAYGAIQQGKTAAAVGRNNQIMAEYAAQDATRRGDEAAMRMQQRGRAVVGAQRAAFGARGLDMNVGTAAELQDQADFFANTDAVTARNNGRREAWTDRATGSMARFQGDSAESQSQLGAFSTLLNGSSAVADKWYTPKKN